MKVSGTNVDIRCYEPSEKIELFAHSGECRYCDGVVKMRRTIKGALDPKGCWCLLCGQHYYVEIKGSIDDWEAEQWKQKGNK